MTGADVGAEPRVLPFRILTVCTGNICRSPMAERLLQTGLNERFPGQFVVESAGTGALVGSPIDPRIAEFIRMRGSTADNFSARQLTPEILQGQDLVLGLTRDHRSRVVEMSPSVLRRAFTLREFARLVQAVGEVPVAAGAERWRAAVPRALRARSIASTTPRDDDDVADPYRRSAQEYGSACTSIHSAVRSVLAAPVWA